VRENHCAVMPHRQKRSARNARLWHRAPIVIAVVPAGPGRLTAVVTGDIDILTAPHLEATLQDAIDDHRPQTLTIDLAGVTFLDAAGMTALIRTYGHADHVDISLTNARPMVVRVLGIAGLVNFLHLSA
jgi:anti-anti-sigma factor